jgi:hypothetical protein
VVSLGSQVGVRVTWRQLVHYLNLAGYYAVRATRKGVPGRSEGFSVREELDGTVRLAYVPGSENFPAAEQAKMLSAYAAVLRSRQLQFDVDENAISVLGWLEPAPPRALHRVERPAHDHIFADAASFA